MRISQTMAFVGYRAATDALGKAAFFAIMVLAARRLPPSAFGLVALGIVFSWLGGVTGFVTTGLSTYVHELIGENAGGVFDRLLSSADLGWRSWVPVAAVFAVLCGNVIVQPPGGTSPAPSSGPR